MDNELKEYVCGVFNFDSEEEWESVEHIINTGRRVHPYGPYSHYCMTLAEGLARYIDKNISKH